MNKKDPVVLSYDESLLRKSDVELLQGPHWLSDNIISFYFEYLKNTFKDSNLLFVSPEVTQCIKLIPISQMPVFLDPLEANTRDFIFLALNDNERPQTVGGSHWSLVVFSRFSEAVYHFDSSIGSNREPAEHLAKKLFAYFKIGGRFKEERSLQQSNGYDCGIFVITYAKHLCELICSNRNSRQDVLSNVGCEDYLSKTVRGMRQDLINIIEQLRE